MLLTISLGLTVLVVLALLLNPAVGVLLMFIAKPVIDTTFDSPVLGGFTLLQIIGAAVPVIVAGHLLVRRSDRSEPPLVLPTIWVIYGLDVLFFSLVIVATEDLAAGSNVFFRHINGLVGFLLLQAYFTEKRQLRSLFLALIIAGLFPIGVGIYQTVTGVVWRVEESNGVVRSIGLWHDGVNLREYVLQAVLGLLLYFEVFARQSAALRATLLAYGVLAVIVLVRGYSKAGFLTMGAWVLCWTLLQRKTAALVALILPVTAGALWYSPQLAGNIARIFYKEAGALTGTVDSKMTFAGRWFGWKEMLDQWMGFPLLGKVFGSGHPALGAHNDFLQMLFHGGLVGLGIYVALLTVMGYRLIVNLRRQIDPLRVGALMAYLMWMIDTIGLVPSAYSAYQWFVWGLIGLSLRSAEFGEEATSVQADAERASAPAQGSGLRVLQPVPVDSRRYPLLST
ncbi:MAG: O-antigen ligase family protein [Nitrospira sp.]|nr:MAG: O-antigen ligase family protein [Nitrospira sp.]